MKRLYAERARPVVRRLLRLLADVSKAAERFGIDPAALSLAGAHAAVAAIQARVLARARVYGEAVEQVRVLGDEAMAGAAAADLVPEGTLGRRHRRARPGRRRAARGVRGLTGRWKVAAGRGPAP